MIVLVVILLLIYLAPGLYFARSYYSNEIRTFRSTPKQLVPPKPERPRISIHEMLHTSSPIKCGLLKGHAACSCRYREDWIELKNDWADYTEWVVNYGHIKDGVTHIDEPSIGKAFSVIPAWPVYKVMQFITAGAKAIPDYREIERMEEEMRELEV